MLNLLPIGTEVELRGGVIGWITAATVRGLKAGVSYEVRWWDHSTLNTEWFDEYEIVAKAPARPFTIGFDT